MAYGVLRRLCHIFFLERHFVQLAGVLRSTQEPYIWLLTTTWLMNLTGNYSPYGALNVCYNSIIARWYTMGFQRRYSTRNNHVFLGRVFVLALQWSISGYKVKLRICVAISMMYSCISCYETKLGIVDTPKSVINPPPVTVVIVLAPRGHVAWGVVHDRVWVGTMAESALLLSLGDDCSVTKNHGSWSRLINGQLGQCLHLM